MSNKYSYYNYSINVIAALMTRPQPGLELLPWPLAWPAC